MDFSKMTLKEAMTLGFFMGLASPALLFSPLDLSSAKESDKIINNGLLQDELKVLTDYGYQSTSNL